MLLSSWPIITLALDALLYDRDRHRFLGHLQLLVGLRDFVGGRRIEQAQDRAGGRAPDEQQRNGDRINDVIFSIWRMIIGLQWPDVDWDQSLLHVRRAIVRGRVTTPKTAGSQRDVDIPPSLLTELMIYRELVPPVGVDSFILRDRQGHHLDPEAWTRTYLRPFLHAHGVAHLGLHSFRHYYASLLVNSGQHLKYVSRQLEGFAMVTPWTTVPVRPTRRRQVRSARPLAGKAPLELRHRPREIGPSHAEILHMGSVESTG